jgi:catechol 2,3-dioxygenase-like lactoylglutathione lyase family enzyme
MAVMHKILFSLLILVPGLWGQLAPPNDAGVTMGHLHLVVKDVAAQQDFWVSMLGGKLVRTGDAPMIQFPGVYVILRKGEPVGPPAGSIVDHFGFVAKDLAALRARWQAVGLKFDQSENPNSGYINGPEGIRLEVFGDPSLAVPVQMNHIHFFATDIPATKAWYAKTFGGVPGQRACVSCVSAPRMIETTDLPGTNLSFNQAGNQGKDIVGTKGRVLDHIGFDVMNLVEFAAKLEAQGVKLDIPVRQIPNSKTKIAFLTDPWGTYIELTENLGK